MAAGGGSTCLAAASWGSMAVPPDLVGVTRLIVCLTVHGGSQQAV